MTLFDSNTVSDSTISFLFYASGQESGQATEGVPLVFTTRVYFTFVKSAIKKPASNLGWTVPWECAWVGGKP